MIESSRFPHEKAESQSGEAGLTLVYSRVGPLPSSSLTGIPGSAHPVLGTCAVLCLPLFVFQLIDLRTQSRLNQDLLPLNLGFH